MKILLKIYKSKGFKLYWTPSATNYSNRGQMTGRHLSWNPLSKPPHHTSGRTFVPGGFNVHQTRLHEGSSVEPGFEPGALRPRGRDLTYQATAALFVLEGPCTRIYQK
ncbi:hypothetical protein AVEN_46664-1 [Araneus ventricosus]|uniref:Uncharacterized protein n=1 Tax=Araneus ventricosus TaxID=182803 RepID=A0A4Y2LRC2_ARAVE|nr:hypothetical protein AVEN_46664-1 [Araneus ventricosus]